MGSSETEEQLRVRALLADTITLLCKNGLSFKQNMTIQGLIGITLDSNVFLVHLNENFRGEDVNPINTGTKPTSGKPAGNQEKSPRKRKRRRSSDQSSIASASQEAITLDPVVEIKCEPIVIDNDEDSMPSSIKIQPKSPRTTSVGHYEDEDLTSAMSTAAGAAILSSFDNSFSSQPQGLGLGHSFNHGSSTASNHEPYVSYMMPNITNPEGQGSSNPQWTGSRSSIDITQPQPLMSTWPGSAVTPGGGIQNSAVPASSQTRPVESPTKGSFPCYLEISESPTGSRLYGPQCTACDYVQKQRRWYTETSKLRKQGIPKQKLPKFTEPRVLADKHCVHCQRRCAANNIKMRRSRHRKKLGISMDSSSVMGDV